MHDDTHKSDTAKKEEAILEFWKENDIFKKSLEKKSPKGDFVFYEGPPTANGRPGLHHLESRAFKDVIPRYKTMRGYRVRRRAGWDTHGLPVEIETEKQLGFSGKQEIEKFGIAPFNRRCRESVLQYIDEWWRFTERMGYWVNQDEAYYTFNASYMESVWHIIKHTAANGRLYKDFKVVPWCPRCETALSSHELAQGYDEVVDLSVTAKFEIKNPTAHGLSANTFLLAWTTTPWTLPGNVALAVNSSVEYGIYHKEGERVIAARAREEVLGEGWHLEETRAGADLTGIQYVPLFPFLSARAETSANAALSSAFRVYAADFVTTEEGTGIVHTAVLYGQDDFELGTKVGLPKIHLVNEKGCFVEETDFLSGRFVRDEAVAVDIVKDLHKRELLFAKSKYSHTYPFCWRCKTPLIYYARDSWFVRMNDLSETLVAENKKVRWEPSHIRDGRMGEWLSGVRDWAISRERYWATPLPVWESEEGEERIVIGSIRELRTHTQKSGNTYLLMRHGQAKSNAQDIASTMAEEDNHLTELGREQALRTAEKLRTAGIDLIITTPILRARETAHIVAETIGYPIERIAVDDRMREIDVGEFEGKSNKEFHTFFGYSYETMFEKRPEGGENLADVKRRVGEFLYDLEKTHQGKKILIVAHEYPIWLAEAVALGADAKETIALKEPRPEYYDHAEVRTLDFVPLPHNDDYELDLHRPYIDEVVLVSGSGKAMRRVTSVIDVWFDSGAMPFAQDHYPFKNKKRIDGNGYPADYIAEAIDQTRGWFYTLLAIGVLMGRGRAYKNVICLGHLLDGEGKKMSKSKGNVIEPFEAMREWGADTLRFWMYSVNSPGDSKNFDEKTVREAASALSWLENSARFFELASLAPDGSQVQQPVDVWMQARTDEAVRKVTEAFEAYDIMSASRNLARFFEDISQWYVRRIRDRVRDGDRAAIETLRQTLHTAARLAAPFTPFLAERVFRSVRRESDPESVHLCDWPAPRRSLLARVGMQPSPRILSDMDTVRHIVSVALKARQHTGMKVRQPLAKLTVRDTRLAGKEEYLSLIKDEVNVKEVVFDETLSDEAVLDTTITPELKEEGMVRELVRFIQDLRKKAGLEPGDTAVLVASTDERGEAFLNRHWETFAKTANLKARERGQGEKAPVEGMLIALAIKQ